MILAPTVGTEFDGPGIPAGWTTGSWTGGATTVDGEATVDGSWLRADGLVGAGRALEFSATFSGERFQNAGFGVTLDSGSEPWAMFGTNATRARAAGPRQQRRGVRGRAARRRYIGSEHTYRIEWDSAPRSGSPSTATPIRAHGSGRHRRRPCGRLRATSTPAAAPCRVDWMRMSPYATSGTFTSRVLDAGALADWRTLEVTDTTPAGTAIGYEVRIGDTTDPDDGTWSAFTPIVGGGDVPGMSRYAQYRATLTTTAPGSTPVVERVAIGSRHRAARPHHHRRHRVGRRGQHRHGGVADPGTALGTVRRDRTVNWTTAPTAGLVPGQDYDTASGTLVFVPGDTEELIYDHRARRQHRRTRRALRRRMAVPRHVRAGQRAPSAPDSSAPSPTASSPTTTRTPIITGGIGVGHRGRRRPRRTADPGPALRTVGLDRDRQLHDRPLRRPRPR